MFPARSNVGQRLTGPIQLPLGLVKQALPTAETIGAGALPTRPNERNAEWRSSHVPANRSKTHRYHLANRPYERRGGAWVTAGIWL